MCECAGTHPSELAQRGAPLQADLDKRMTAAVTSKHRTGLVRPGTPQSALRSLKPSLLPCQIQPMLCTLISDAFDDPNWTFEPKLDGQRILGRFDGEKIKLLSRSANPDSRDSAWTRKPAMFAAKSPPEMALRNSEFHSEHSFETELG